jgi:hypothetical protein
VADPDLSHKLVKRDLTILQSIFLVGAQSVK